MPSLHRDGLTRLVYGHLAVYGFFLYGFGPAVPLLREDQGVSRAVSGLHGTALAVGALLAGLLTARAAARWGRGPVLRGGLGGVCAGIVLFTATTALPLTLLGALVAGGAGTLVVNAHATILSDRHGPAGPAAVSEANALAAGTGVLAPLALGSAVDLGAGWRAGLLLTVPLALTVTALGRRTSVPEHRSGPSAAAVAGRLPRRYWAAWLVLLLCVCTEFTLTLWSSELLRERVGMTAGAATASVTALVAGMTVGRLVGSRLALRHSPDRLLLGALGVTGCGFALLWLSTAELPAVAGLFTSGLGLAVQFPLGISRAIAAAADRPDLAAARASLAAALAIGLGPFLLGALADGVGTHGAFLLVPALLAAAAAVVLASGVRRPVPAAA